MSDVDGQIRQVLTTYVAEALDLRFGGKLPTSGATVPDMLEALLDVRQRLDRVEEILTRIIRLRARLRRNATIATASVDESWDRAVQNIRTAPVSRGGDLSGPRERYAEANLIVLDERRSARAVEELAGHADEAHDVVRLVHRGLDGVRHDHLTILRAVQVETSLDR